MSEEHGSSMSWPWKLSQVILNFPLKVGLFSNCGCIRANRYVWQTRLLCSSSSSTEDPDKLHSNYKPLCVSEEVARLLEMSKPTFVNGRYVKAKLSARHLAEKRKQYIAAGYYWPEKPLRDRSLDMTSKGTKQEREKVARQKLIEENMKKMPQMIAEYRAKMKELRAKKRELQEKQKEKQFEAQHLGYHPKDPRGLQNLLQQEALEAKKNKKMQKKAQRQN